MELNFFPIDFDFLDYQITKTPVQEELLKELRQNYNSTHSFFQRGDYIYISNKQGEEINIGETDTISISNKQVTESLIKHIFFRTILEKFPTLKPLDFYPFVIQSQRREQDLLYTLLPENLKGKISYVKHIVIQLRVLEIDSTLIYGFTINIERNWKFDICCQQINEEGFDLYGYEVIHSIPIPGLENILLPDESLVGTILKTEGNIAVVATNEGEKTLPLEELYLKKSNRNIKNYLIFKTGEERAESILNRLKIEKVSVIQLKRIREEIQDIYKRLFLENDGSKTLFQNKDGFCFKVNNSNSLQLPSLSLENPVFVFDPSRTKTSFNPDKGLTDYGAYDSSMFDIKKPDILFICKSENRGYASNFIEELRDGLPNSSFFKKGLKRKYDLQDVNIIFREVNNFNLSEYQLILQKLSDKPHIALMEISLSFKDVKDIPNNLYYQLKALFLGKEIPVQFVTTENIKKYDEYKLNAIALQMYAKMGGIPWTIATKKSYDKEIVIGIGHSIIRDNAFTGNSQERVVGITTFFSADGQYLMANKVKDVSYEEYFNELLESLKSSIERLEKDYAWQEGDTIRLIFHIFKPIKEIEFGVVKELIKQFDKFKIQFAFVTLSEFHPFLMYDETQKGKQKWQGAELIGGLVPQRGANIVLDPSSCLVQTLGVNEMKTNKFGSSKPLLIKIRQPQRESETYDEVEEFLFTDLHYIANQIFKFTYLSWRGFLPNLKPATMLYSNLISKLLGKLRRIPGWQPDSVNFNLKYKKWFL